MNKLSNSTCNNCGKHGHQFHQCKLPITSYGIIVCRPSTEGIQFLMICRKDTFGYVDLIRGKYSPYNMEQIQNCINEMSQQEKSRLLQYPFDVLWKKMWGEPINSNQYRNEEAVSVKKFETIKSGVTINNNVITLNDLIQNSTTSWSEPEWEFPKGRRNYQEKDLDCALREFEEETGYSSKNISIIENIVPFEEMFIGSNHKSYKHKYFLAYTNNTIDNLQNYQKTEVSKVEWKTIDECLNSIRPYHLEKKKIIININNMLKNYSLCYSTQ